MLLLKIRQDFSCFFDKCSFLWYNYRTNGGMVMRVSYSKQTILDYIAGNDIPEELVEKLEDNEQFMMEVINLTKDKNMYHYCSSKLKNDFEFVKFLIRTFSTDDAFIKQVLDTYIENHQDEEDKINKLELSIILRDIYRKNQNEEGYLNHQLYLTTIYTSELMNINFALNDRLIQDILDELDLGFIFVKDIYGESEIVVDFFAEEFLRSIIYDKDENFEEATHVHFKDFNSIEEMGYMNYIIEYVSRRDSYLAEYLSTKPEIINSITKEQLEFIKSNWNTYLRRINQEKVSIVLEKLEEYEKNGPGIDLEYREVLRKIVTELGLNELFEQNSDLYEDVEDMLEEDCDFIDDGNKSSILFDILEELDISKLNNDFDEEEYSLFRKKMTNFIKKLFETDIIDESLIDEYQEEVDDEKCKVIKYDFNSKKVLNISNK